MIFTLGRVPKQKKGSNQFGCVISYLVFPKWLVSPFLTFPWWYVGKCQILPLPTSVSLLKQSITWKMTSSNTKYWSSFETVNCTSWNNHSILQIFHVDYCIIYTLSCQENETFLSFEQNLNLYDEFVQHDFCSDNLKEHKFSLGSLHKYVIFMSRHFQQSTTLFPHLGWIFGAMHICGKNWANA